MFKRVELEEGNDIGVFRIESKLGVPNYITEFDASNASMETVLKKPDNYKEDKNTKNKPLEAFTGDFGVEYTMTDDQEQRFQESLGGETGETTANIPMQPSNVEKILAGIKTSTIRSDRAAKEINIPVKGQAIVKFGNKPTPSPLITSITSWLYAPDLDFTHVQSG